MWEEFGDALDHQVEAVGKGAAAIVGFRYRAETHDGTNDVTEQVRVFDSDDNRVAMDSKSDEQLTSESGFLEWEHAIWFDTSDWDLGRYRFEIIIRDNVTNKTSEAYTAISK